MTEIKKYKLLEASGGLFCIKALRDFGNVKNGDLGGLIESERNLSHDGDAWVYENARVYEDAEVYENARVYGDARISGNAKICGNVWVYGNSAVYKNSRVYEDTKDNYTIEFDTEPESHVLLCRLRAFRDFGDVKKSNLGGLIESENNLSHEGSAWVSGDDLECQHTNSNITCASVEKTRIFNLDLLVRGKMHYSLLVDNCIYSFEDIGKILRETNKNTKKNKWNDMKLKHGLK